jgi:hypothetical protein
MAVSVSLVVAISVAMAVSVAVAGRAVGLLVAFFACLVVSAVVAVAVAVAALPLLGLAGLPRRFMLLVAESQAVWRDPLLAAGAAAMPERQALRLLQMP